MHLPLSGFKILTGIAGCGGKFTFSCLIVIFAGCVAQTNTYLLNHDATKPPQSARILVIQPDVMLSEITTGGLEEPRADWTKRARLNIENALNTVMIAKKDTMAFYQQPLNDPDELYANNQILKLHETVGETILLHKYLPMYSLPTKAKIFDWSLSNSVVKLGVQYNADCALFVYLRDSYASIGRKTVIVAASILGSYYVPEGGLQVGFASLVDLKSGKLIWFNRLYRTVGDLRTSENALTAVRLLLRGIPL